MRISIIVPVAAALLAASPVVASSAVVHPNHTPELTGFHRAVQKYVSLHRALEAGLPALEVSSDAEQIRRAVDALAGAIGSARAGAQSGDVFTKKGGSVIRARIHAALDRNAYDATVLLRAMSADDEGEWPPPRVNGSFPWMAGNGMWFFILAELPELPEELEYRFVGRDLVLLDVHASLVVDILPAALPVGQARPRPSVGILGAQSP